MTTPSALPVILHVDDNPEDLRDWQMLVEASGKAQLLRRHPHEVKEEDLKSASLLLVDVKLESWPQRDQLESLSLQPRNGLALLAILQEHVHEVRNASPCAFALYTGAIHEIARGLVSQPHLVARAYNLEWVINKAQSADSRLHQVLELAGAVQVLPNDWPGETPEEAEKAVKSWLGLKEPPSWESQAWRSVLQCHPPAHELAEHTRGVALLRWFLHRILPYPCFLLDEMHLAARLRVTPGSLRRSLASGTGLCRELGAVMYTGQCANFHGRRWWRSGVEALVFDLAREDPSSIDFLHEKLRELDPTLEFLRDPTVVPILNAKYEFESDLLSIDDAILVQPDDWPPYADHAWTSAELAREEDVLRAIVVPNPDEY